MPESNATWEEKKDQLYKIVNRLNSLQAQVNAEVKTELVEIAQLVTEVAAGDPGTWSIGAGNRPGGPG